MSRFFNIVLLFAAIAATTYYVIIIARLTEAHEFDASAIGSQQGKTFLITGANRGLGLASAQLLVEANANVILACRKMQNCIEAQQSLRSKSSSELRVDAIEIDLSDLESIREAVDELETSFDTIDVLILNAGIMMPEQFAVSKQGHEIQFAVNHLGHMALTVGLLNAFDDTIERVVVVSSVAHMLSRGLDIDDLSPRRKFYDKARAYADSKLCNLLFARRLQAHVRDALGSNALVLAAHPGWTATDLQRTSFVQHLNFVLAMEPREGALAQVRAAVDESACSLDYFGPSALFHLIGAPVRQEMSANAHDDQVAEQLWQYSMRLIEEYLEPAE
jgi:NAD(P)-dependent dehydrogenase (short-subunit alcohol dehydrogenase family)